MKILKSVNSVPGGLMVVPLFLGMVLNTFFPDLLRIGGFTQALTGAGYPTVAGDVPLYGGHENDLSRRAAHAAEGRRHSGG
jgi:hypothetical protein